MKKMCVLGAGPAGTAAAITLLQNEKFVEIIEKSSFPRHKVCGEFLSPEARDILDGLGVWQDFLALSPAKISRMILHIGNCVRSCSLPEIGWGMSRYTLDHLLYSKAKSLGATESMLDSREKVINIMAVGRTNIARKGRRLFGFKAHFQGPVGEAVELFFFDNCYVGVCAVEGGITNVCGLGPEDFLRRYDFDFDAVVGRSRPLADRLRPLTRTMKWLSTGPLVFRNFFADWPQPNLYPAGDALSFVDPFTGSGIVSALLSGRLAGQASACEVPVRDYLNECRRRFGPPFIVAGCIRKILQLGLAEKLAPLIPSTWLFSLTRPHGRA